MPCHAQITYTLNDGDAEYRRIERDTQMEIFEQICTEGVRIEMQSREFSRKIRRVEIRLERDE